MKLIKSLILGVALMATALIPLQAQQLMSMTALAANTSSNILAAAYIVDNFIVVNATTNNATVTFYDSSNTTTTAVQAAYTAYTSYATNYSTVFTNEANVLVTNTFSGIYTAPVATSSTTNARPAVQILLIPASSTLNKDVRIQVMRGLTAVPSQNLTLLTTYRNP